MWSILQLKNLRANVDHPSSHMASPSSTSSSCGSNYSAMMYHQQQQQQPQYSQPYQPTTFYSPVASPASPACHAEVRIPKGWTKGNPLPQRQPWDRIDQSTHTFTNTLNPCIIIVIIPTPQLTPQPLSIPHFHTYQPLLCHTTPQFTQTCCV